MERVENEVLIVRREISPILTFRVWLAIIDLAAEFPLALRHIHDIIKKGKREDALFFVSKVLTICKANFTINSVIFFEP
jgi:hypothetical protein